MISWYHFENANDPNWPPTVEDFEEESIPNSLALFQKYLLNAHDSKIKPSESVNRIMNSLASDMIDAVSQGKCITKKHYLLALGLHNMTGQRHVIDIVNRLSHYINFNTTCEIETTLAKKARVTAETLSSLQFIPTTSKFFLTVFWVDNFYVKVERQSVKNAINTTHLVAFQVPDELSKINQKSLTTERTKARKIQTVHTDEYYMKSVQIRSFFWSVFSHIRIEYRTEKTPCLDTFHAVETATPPIIPNQNSTKIEIEHNQDKD